MTVPPRGDDPTIPPAPPAGRKTQKDQLDAEVRQATRYERGLAVKMLIALGVVAVIVVIRLLVV